MWVQSAPPPPAPPPRAPATAPQCTRIEPPSLFPLTIGSRRPAGACQGPGTRRRGAAMMPHAESAVFAALSPSWSCDKGSPGGGADRPMLLKLIRALLVASVVVPIVAFGL